MAIRLSLGFNHLYSLCHLLLSWLVSLSTKYHQELPESQLKNPNQIGLWSHLWGIVLFVDWSGETQSIVVNATPGQGFMNYIRKLVHGTRVMDQQLRALVLVEDLGSVPESTYQLTVIWNPCSIGSRHLCIMRTCGAKTCMQIKYSYT